MRAASPWWLSFGLGLSACGGGTMVTEPGSMSEPGSITEGSAAAADSPTEAERWVWHPIATGVEASLRGLAIGPDGVVWASGTHGTVLAATGEDVVNVSVPGVDDDLRSLAVLDARTVLVVSAGRPARFFRTSDAGATWSETHSDDREGIFVDALAFRDAREGLAVGDPLPGDEGPRFVVFRTHDGGVTWGSSLGPLALEGEAAFAASNGALVLLPPRGAAFVTGGAGARVHWTDDVDAARWTSRAIPGHEPAASRGLFALVPVGAAFVAVGGDYAHDATPGVLVTDVFGTARTSALAGYRSSAVALDDGVLVVGTSGSELLRGGGTTPIGTEPLHTVASRGGTTVAVGPHGTLHRLVRGR